jgi:hypothetical protein
LLCAVDLILEATMSSENKKATFTLDEFRAEILVLEKAAYEKGRRDAASPSPRESGVPELLAKFPRAETPVPTAKPGVVDHPEIGRRAEKIRAEAEELGLEAPPMAVAIARVYRELDLPLR